MEICGDYQLLKIFEKQQIRVSIQLGRNQFLGNVNFMKPNPKKCKELCVCFLREKPVLSPLLIDGHALEVVRSHKVLGLVIQNDLKWNEHIESVISKGL